MTRATLSEVLQPALAQNYAVAGLVCLGWEDARAFAAAAEAEGTPVILQAGPGARAHMPLPVWAAMFHGLAESTSVPVVLHLDHGASEEECRIAIEEGFTSVMFDGSRLPLDENIELTGKIAEMAHRAGVSCEGEIGFVGYQDGQTSIGTNPDEAARFAAETAIDAMAISIGNLHLQTAPEGRIDEARLRAIETMTKTPLVLHGGSGLPRDLRSRLARKSNVCKFNIGTELRLAFGDSLRAKLARDPNVFDRISILGATEATLTTLARRIIRDLR
jgi:fructose-bisphosphate aldolase class II